MAIIGGFFPLPLWPSKANKPPAFWGERKLLLANGRSGLWMFRNRTVWLPSYCCDSMITTLPNCKFYDVSDNLLPRLPVLEENDLVVLINYFGIPHRQECYDHIKNCGAEALEDASWSLLTPPTPQADYVLYSPGKIVGVPDGGILLCRKSVDVELGCQPSDEWMQQIYRARLERFLNPEANHVWYPLFLEVKNAPIGPYAMSKLSEGMLEGVFDYEDMAVRCKRNFAFLAERLQAIIKPLASSVSTGFPIVVEDRDRVQKKLADEKIFCPVLWRFKKVPCQFDKSYWLSNHLLVIPCDYRYDVTDMQRVVQLLG